VYVLLKAQWFALTLRHIDPNSAGAGSNGYNAADTANFLLFLRTLRGMVGTSKAISLAVPAQGYLGSDGNVLVDATPFAKVVE